MVNQTKFNWKVFFALWFASIVGIVAVLPYALTLQAPLLDKNPLPIPFETLIAVQIVQNAVLFGVVLLLGLFLAKRIGLGAPILERLFAGEKIVDDIKPFLLPTVIFGVVGALIIIGLDTFGFYACTQSRIESSRRRIQRRSNHSVARIPGFVLRRHRRRDFASIVFDVIAGRVGQICQSHLRGSTNGWRVVGGEYSRGDLVWLGAFACNGCTDVDHTARHCRAIVLNGLLGIGFGYFYSKYGLESAMLSHFSADLVLHVLFSI